ncbi:hypothetical protein C0033_17280 [Clostridium sp. chh4-2]|uniref:Rpn family recombination-promoting nuclease/putative transposase n=1 Tax=Clostridium sp. chh4-2 TaxID=2067550 RepID=UPI000CCF1FD2|nr:Rpn family recombination-promoting nuclease/putative transposase [Clostridium sp. chh4-2]PNV60729.1 hypothetical protein C0033_17280 [Clostridium sp. chh4-2]
MKEKKNSTIREIHDQGAKAVFEDPILCAEFLRDYVNLDILKNITPEQITNISERFVSLWDEERNSDTVNKIELGDGSMLYFIALIEHQSLVSFEMCMKLLRYMVMIWNDYEKEMEKLSKGITKTKNFKYPPILPIVYYEGTGEWTASKRLSERIYLSDIFREFIPDFAYKVVRLHDYTNKEIIDFGDELSLIMLINKLRNSNDFKDLQEIPPKYFDHLETHTPDYLLNLISAIVAAFLHRLNVPKNEVAEFTDMIKERRISMLFDSFEAYDVQETRKVSREEGKIEGKIEGIRTCVVDLLQELGELPEELASRITDETDMSVLKYWLKLAAKAETIDEFESKISE